MQHERCTSPCPIALISLQILYENIKQKGCIISGFTKYINMFYSGCSSKADWGKCELAGILFACFVLLLQQPRTTELIERAEDVSWCRFLVVGSKPCLNRWPTTLHPIPQKPQGFSVLALFYLFIMITCHSFYYWWKKCLLLIASKNAMELNGFVKTVDDDCRRQLSLIQ